MKTYIVKHKNLLNRDSVDEVVFKRRTELGISDCVEVILLKTKSDMKVRTGKEGQSGTFIDIGFKTDWHVKRDNTIQIVKRMTWEQVDFLVRYLKNNCNVIIEPNGVFFEQMKDPVSEEIRKSFVKEECKKEGHNFVPSDKRLKCTKCDKYMEMMYDVE